MKTATTYYERLNDLVIGWGYSENEAREMLAEEGADYGYTLHNFDAEEN